MSHPDGAQWRRSDTQQDEPVSRPRLLDQVRDVIRCKHYSIRTEQTYLDWIKRYILFHNKQHPAGLSERHVEAFLTHLAVNRNVASSTRNQALCAIVFLYRDVLKMTLGVFEQITWAKKPQKLPVVFTPEEVKQLLLQLALTFYYDSINPPQFSPLGSIQPRRSSNTCNEPPHFLQIFAPRNRFKT